MDPTEIACLPLPAALVDALTLCVEQSPGAAFEPLERVALRKASAA